MKLKLKMRDVRRVARRTVEALNANGYRCCLFGSAACSMTWDNTSSRVPGDLDVVVFTNDDPEIIKRSLVDTNGRFYLVKAKGGPWNVLWYSICRSPELKIKVDILTPGRKPLGIPRVPAYAVSLKHGNIPVMPFIPLLILKVQGWRDHRVSWKPWFRKKIPQDEEDIEILLSMVDDHLNLRGYGWLMKWSWFKNNAEKLIEAYVSKFPDSFYRWRSMGFDV